MLNLPNVTLIAADCKQPLDAATALTESAKAIKFAAVKLLTHEAVPFDAGEVVLIPKIKDWHGYSEFIFYRLHEFIETEKVLIVQHDGFVLSPHLWRSEFLNFDYIGHRWEDCPKNGMNGGMSLRSKALMTYVSQLKKLHPTQFIQCHPEDSSITRLYRDELERAGFKFAPYEVADQFSRKGKTDQAFGFHLRKSEWPKLNTVTTRG